MGDAWLDMREAYARLTREKNALDVSCAGLRAELAETAAENAKLRESLKDEPCAVCGTRANEMLGDDKCVACERDDARYHIQRWAEGTQVVGSHRSCQCAICDTLYRKAERLKEQKEGGDDESD